MSLPLLLIHAFPVDAGMWEAQLSGIAGRKVIAPNLPGFGGAPSTEPVLTMKASAKACVEALDAAGEQAAVVCGLSMGGYVAFEMLRRYPRQVGGLVLANTRADADDAAKAESRRELAKRLLSEGNAFLAENPPPLLSDEAPEAMWKQVRRSIARQPAKSIAAASLGMAERADSTGDLAAIRVPTLVITSSADTLIPPDITSSMAGLIPGAELAEIREAGHLSNIESAGEFNSLVAAHARRCDSG